MRSVRFQAGGVVVVVAGVAAEQGRGQGLHVVAGRSAWILLSRKMARRGLAQAGGRVGRFGLDWEKLKPIRDPLDCALDFSNVGHRDAWSPAPAMSVTAAMASQLARMSAATASRERSLG